MEIICNTRPELFLTGEYANAVVGNSRQILRLLFDSKDSGHSVAVKSSKLGDGYYVTVVDDIILHEGDTTILLKSLGEEQSVSSKVKLADIDAVFPLVSHYSMPLSKFWTRHPTWFF